MPLYRCLIRGENFAWKNGSRWELMGFYTTRWVMAYNANSAEKKAVTLLGRDAQFDKPAGYYNGPSAVVLVEEIEKVGIFPARRQNRGATWFPMTENGALSP